jgi:hypothetical protein
LSGEAQQIITALATDRRVGRIGGVALTPDQELLDICGVRDEQLSEVRDPDQPITQSTLPYAADGRLWREQLGARWSPTASPAIWAPALSMSRPSPPP